MSHILEIKNLTMRFGGIVALENLSFNVQRNSVTALIGPNGAGKTTVFNCITGFYKATEGQLLMYTKDNRTDIKKLLGEKIGFAGLFSPELPSKLFYKFFGGTHRVVKAGLARTFQNIRLFQDMTVLENLLVAQNMYLNTNLVAGLLNLPGYRQSEKKAIEKAYYWLDILGLNDQSNRLAGELPYGQARRLEIARAMCTNPEVICLDEPAAGLNPKETENLTETVNFIRDKFNVTVFLIEHDMSMVMKISEHIIVLDHGIKIAQGNPEEIKNNEAVIKAYLGSE